MISDIAINESGSGGDLNLINDDLNTIEGLSNQVYLALFGGNIESSTSEDLDNLDQRDDWWGNSLLSKENQFNSLFEKTISTIALNSAGLSKLIDAAKEDLKYLEEYAIIDIDANIVSLNRINLLVNLTEPNSESLKIKFVWDGQKNELIEQKII